jgi:hypothetical protein
MPRLDDNSSLRWRRRGRSRETKEAPRSSPGQMRPAERIQRRARARVCPLTNCALAELAPVPSDSIPPRLCPTDKTAGGGGERRPPRPIGDKRRAAEGPLEMGRPRRRAVAHYRAAAEKMLAARSNLEMGLIGRRAARAMRPACLSLD